MTFIAQLALALAAFTVPPLDYDAIPTVSATQLAAQTASALVPPGSPLAAYPTVLFCTIPGYTFIVAREHATLSPQPYCRTAYVVPA